MKMPGIESLPSGPSSLPATPAKLRAKPPTVKEIKNLDQWDGPLQLPFGALPHELNLKILGFVVRISNCSETWGMLRELIKLQRVSKGMRWAGRCLMLQSVEEWKLGACLQDDFILTHLHPGLAKAEAQELLEARWGLNAAAADTALKKLNESTATAQLLKAKGLSECTECTDRSKNVWRVDGFDSSGISNPKDWLAKASHVDTLMILLWCADPPNLLVSLAPQLKTLEIDTLGAGDTLNLALTPALFEALGAGKIRSLGLPGLPPRPQLMAGLAQLLGKVSRLESLTIRLGVRQGAHDTSWTAPLFTAIKAMPKLSNLQFIIRGNGFAIRRRRRP